MSEKTEEIVLHPFRGTHILGEMYGIEASLLNDSNFLLEHLRKGIAASGATLCSWQVKEFKPGGLTILALLSESHTSIHSYPEFGSLFFDAFTCGDTCFPMKIASALEDALKPQYKNYRTLVRGASDNSITHSTQC